MSCQSGTSDFCSYLYVCSLQVRIDHSSRTLSFGSDLNYSTREDAPLGPFLQNMPSEHIRNQLTAMSSVLSKAVATIRPAHILVSVCIVLHCSFVAHFIGLLSFPH